MKTVPPSWSDGKFTTVLAIGQASSRLFSTKVCYTTANCCFHSGRIFVELSSDPLENIRTLLTSAVRKRLMADRRIGCFLSGGLDSSLIAGLLVQEAKKANLPYKIQVGSSA